MTISSHSDKNLKKAGLQCTLHRFLRFVRNLHTVFQNVVLVSISNTAVCLVPCDDSDHVSAPHLPAFCSISTAKNLFPTLPWVHGPITQGLTSPGMSAALILPFLILVCLRKLEKLRANQQVRMSPA